MFNDGHGKVVLDDKHILWQQSKHGALLHAEFRDKEAPKSTFGCQVRGHLAVLDQCHHDAKANLIFVYRVVSLTKHHGLFIVRLLDLNQW